jgi:repressor LexA
MAEVTLTPAERLVLEVLCRAIRLHGSPPPPERIREEAELPSLAAVHYFLDNLQRKKLIRRDAARPRLIEVRCPASAAEPAQPLRMASVEDDREVAGGARPEPPAPHAPAQEPAAAVGTTSAVEEDHPVEEPEGRVFGRGARPGGTDPTLVTVPLLGRVAAGQPIDSVPGEIEATYRLPRALVGHEDPLFMVRVQGASMLGRGIHDQDLVVAHRQPDAENGQLVVVRDEDGEAAVKRLWRSDDGRRVELRSANPDYGPLDVARAEILGRIVTVIRTL